MKEFDLDRKREELGKKQAEAYILNPKINPYSKTLERGVEDLLKFGRRCERKIDGKKHEKLMEQMAQCTFQPSLMPCNRRCAIATGDNVHNRLYSHASQRQRSLEAERQAIEAEWKLSASRKARSRSPKPTPPEVTLPAPLKSKPSQFKAKVAAKTPRA